MKTDTSHPEFIGVFEHRTEFIRCLSNGPKNKRELIEETDVSLSTVDRATRELEALDLIEHRQARFEPTPCGRLATQQYNQFENGIEDIRDTQGAPPITTSKLVDTLTQRFDFIECLLEEPLDKRALVTELEASRSTVDRGVRDLEVLGLIEHCGEGYELAQWGQSVAREYSEFEKRLQVIARLKEFLRWIDPAEFDIDLALLTDAELLLPEPYNPYAMVDRNVELLRTAGTVRALMPFGTRHALEAIHESVVYNGNYIEGVVTSGLANAFQSNPRYVELFKELVPTGRFEVFVCDGGLPYLLNVLNETVQIGVDEEGEPRAFLETDSAEVNEWADSVYNDYKQQAKRIVP
jgi:predicted transcriptional regulator